MAGNFDRKLRLPLSHAANMRHGTNGFTYLPKEGVLRIFLALKNSTNSAGFQPANLGTKGQHSTSRPPKPFSELIITEEHSSAYVETEILQMLSCNVFQFGVAFCHKCTRILKLYYLVSFICKIIQSRRYIIT